MHFPIRGPAEIRVKELREVKAASEDHKPWRLSAQARYRNFRRLDTRVSDDRISNGEPIVLRNRHQKNPRAWHRLLQPLALTRDLITRAFPLPAVGR